MQLQKRRSSRPQSAFTLIELMIVVAIIGILAAIAIPSLLKYQSKSKTSEARKFVKKIYDGARTYYMDQGGVRGMQQIPKQFPMPSQDPTPALGTCCAGGNDRCEPQTALWTSVVWTALHFSVDDPHYFMYSYSGSPTAFTARANGDLDCDAVYSTYEMRGIIDAQYADGPAGNASLYREQPLE